MDAETYGYQCDIHVANFLDKKKHFFDEVLKDLAKYSLIEISVSKIGKILVTPTTFLVSVLTPGNFVVK